MQLQPWLAIALTACLAIFAEAQQSGISALAALYPNCSLTCMIEFIPQSPCFSTTGGLDTVCVCANKTLNDQIGLCAEGACTIKELLTTKNATATACHAEVRDLSVDFTYISVTSGAFAFSIFILRIIVRLTTQHKTLFADDWVMILAVFVALPPTVFGPILAYYGIGRDIWTLPFSHITNVLKYFVLGEICYLVGLGLVKVSILCFFLRIFPVRRLQHVIFATILLCVGYSIAFLFATLFQCSPVPYAWEQWHGEMQGSCNQYHLQGYIAAGINILLDLVVMLLPLKQINSLDLSLKKRISCTLMFLVGLFVTVVSGVRLKYLVQFSHTANPTYDYMAPGYWSVIELNVSIICACMPAIYTLVRIWWPKLISSTYPAGSQHVEIKDSETGSVKPIGLQLSRMSGKWGEFHFWEESQAEGQSNANPGGYPPRVSSASGQRVRSPDQDEISRSPQQDDRSVSALSHSDWSRYNNLR